MNDRTDYSEDDLRLTELLDEFLERRRVEPDLSAEEFAANYPKFEERLLKEISEDLAWSERFEKIRPADADLISEVDARKAFHKLKARQHVSRRPSPSIQQAQKFVDFFTLRRLAYVTFPVAAAFLLVSVLVFQQSDERRALAIDIELLENLDGQIEPLVERRPLQTMGAEQPPDRLWVSESGELEIRLTLNTTSYLYVLQWGSPRGISVVFPNRDYSALRNPVDGGKLVYIPDASSRFSLELCRDIQMVAIVVTAERWTEFEAVIASIPAVSAQNQAGLISTIDSMLTFGELTGADSYIVKRFPVLFVDENE